jgi:REP element-mobilizing transposase RayT
MTEKFRGKYRISSTRLQNWNYGWNAPYFVTLCTHDRECYFGKMVHGEMQLSEIGEIVESEWIKTFEMRPDMHLQMGAYVVMPNHFHAIIIIGENEYNQRNIDGGADGRDAMHCVSTPSTPSSSSSSSQNKFGPQSKNLASIIRGFKIGVTKRARQIHPGFAWQSRYHDHIIRNRESFQRIETYILQNPGNWSEDGFYKK